VTREPSGRIDGALRFRAGVEIEQQQTVAVERVEMADGAAGVEGPEFVQDRRAID